MEGCGKSLKGNSRKWSYTEEKRVSGGKPFLVYEKGPVFPTLYIRTCPIQSNKNKVGLFEFVSHIL